MTFGKVSLDKAWQLRGRVCLLFQPTKSNTWKIGLLEVHNKGIGQVHNESF